MHLKRLKLRNFKSFSGAAEIPFQAGFTGVAGPNGMGKSNISDAILFVLGPTSSKALRADRLTHLFFNGGSSKKPATECEVALVFDNKDRLLPVDSDEVELTRYVKLAPSDPNGYYSYFYVNGRRSTQTEIDSVLAHARLAGDGYNLVQQGDVNRIVSMGPVPRRGLVERLAGIAQYDDELSKADAKRTDLETNLGQLNTLLTEIRSHLTALESQRLQAIQYKEVQDQKRRAEARLARADHLMARQEVTSCEAQLTKLRAEVERLQGEAARLEGERDHAAAEIGRIDHEIAERGGVEAAKFKEELDARRMGFARLDENVRQAEEALEALSQRAQALTDQLATDQKELERLEDAASSSAKRLTASENKATAAEKELREATGSADQSQGKLVGVRRQVLELQREQGELEKGWQNSVQSLEAAKGGAATAEREQAQAEDDHQTREIELKDVELRARAVKADRGGDASTGELQKEFFQLKAKEKGLVAAAERLAQEVMELNRRYTALDARLRVRTEGGSRGNPLAAVDFLLSQRNLGRVPGIRGTVEELARFEPEHQTALQVAAGGRFQALVVETDQVAEECIRLLRNEKRGRATFLPLNKMLAGRPHGKALVAAKSEGAEGFAIDLVHFDEELRPAFWYVFGETVVMEDLGSARAQMGGVRLVTLTGDLIEATGAISGGYLETGERGRGSDNAAELKRLGEELRAKSSAEADARAELKPLQERAQTLAEQLAKRGAEAEVLQSNRQLFEKELTQAKDRLKLASERVRASAEALKKAEALVLQTQAASEAAAAKLSSVKGRLAQLQEEYLGHLPGALSTRLRALQEATQKAGEERLALTREVETARAAATAATSAVEAARKELEALGATRKEKTRQVAQLKKSREEAREKLDALRSVENQQLEASKGQAEKKRKLDEARLKVVDQLARAQESLHTRSGLVGQEEIRLAVAQKHLAEVEEAVKAYPSPEPDEKPVPLDELKRAIQTLAGQLEGMGSVNLRALDEYDQEKQRLDDFQSEVDRLGQEKTELVGLVGEIEKKKRAKIAEVVLAVDRGFHEIYGELSGGGEGELVLENPDDPLAGGLLIRARPVGKTVQRLEQLSGGEKSLASLAFIFALQRYDPSPLYVFDEVDMSLDGMNAENVGRMLRRNAERAQFIVISLRKVTLKFAHQLFGVTMHGDGCSQVVNLNLDELVEMDERDRAEARPVALAPGAA